MDEPDTDDGTPANGWLPEFVGQRPPFELGNPYRVVEGNTLARTHGAYSATTVAPLAAEIEQRARTDESWPAYLTDVSYAPAVEAWAHAEAVCVLLRRYLAERSFEDGMTDVHSEETEERRRKGSSSRSTTGRRVRAALDMASRWEATASQHRSRLGLDPLSRAKLGKDVTSARLDLATWLSAETARLEAEQATDQPGEAL